MDSEDFPALRNAFGIEAADGFAAFKERLQARVLFLLTHDSNRLRQLLYRVDVSEALARQAFDAFEAPLIAERLTQLLIERELKKAETRKRGATDWLDA